MKPLLLLHGFTGSPDAWRDVLERVRSDGPVLVPALGGHDGVAPPASFEAEVDRLAGLVRDAGASAAHVCGYSLGGRLAFGLLARHAALFSGATIISANPGLASDAERAPRAEQDEKWAELVEREGVAAFVERWEAQPLFATQAALAAEQRDAQRERRLRHDAHGLAGAMRALSLARMPNFAPALARVELPIALVTGSDDKKFTDICGRLVTTLRRASHRVVPGAGHNVLLERPEVVAEILAGVLAS